jgi:hypothetical protein
MDQHASWHKNKNRLISVTAILSFLNGLAFILFPKMNAVILGISPDEYSIHMTRYYGTCALGYAALLWQLREEKSYRISKAVLSSIVILLSISVIVGIVGMVNEVINFLGIVYVIVDFAISLGGISLLLYVPEAAG